MPSPTRNQYFDPVSGWRTKCQNFALLHQRGAGSSLNPCNSCKSSANLREKQESEQHRGRQDDEGGYERVAERRSVGQDLGQRNDGDARQDDVVDVQSDVARVVKGRDLDSSRLPRQVDAE